MEGGMIEGMREGKGRGRGRKERGFRKDRIFV